MKARKLLSYAIMGILSAGICPAATQIPVGGYHLSGEEPAPTTRPEDGWTWFQLKQETADTLNGDYLLTDQDPVALTGTGSEQPANPIGFDFPFAGRSVDHFGITGNGYLFLSQGNTLNASYKTYSNTIDSNLVWATPQLMLATGYDRRNTCTVASDENTRIGYSTDETNGLLFVGYENLLLSANGQTYRWSYDIVLNQNGDIQVWFRDIETPGANPDESTWNTFGFTFVLKANSGESALYAADWETTTSTRQTYLNVDASTNGQTLTFTYPENCIRPAGVEASASFPLQLAEALEVELSLEGEYDGFIAFLADNNTVEERPEDGKTYATGQRIAGNYRPGDSIGEFPVLLSGNNDFAFTSEDLKPASTYYIYIYPYNSLCAGGPLYMESPIILEANTLQAPPTASIAQMGETSATLSFEGLEADDEIVVGLARRDYGATDRLLDINGQVYQQGDTLFHDPSTEAAGSSYNHGPYLIQTVHAGTVANNTLEMTNLKTATSYYAYIWSRTGDTTYTAQYTALPFRTVSTVDDYSVMVFDFETDRIPGSTESGYYPAGWSRSESSNASFAVAMPQVGEKIDENKSLYLRIPSSGDFVEADAVSPVFQAEYSNLRVHYRIQSTSGSSMSSTTGNLREGDSLTLYYKETGSTEWNLVQTLTSSTILDYAENSFAEDSFTLSSLENGSTYQLRFRFKGQTSAASQNITFSINQARVEPELPCAYPTGIVVNDSLTTHRIIGLEFSDPNVLATQMLYQYREPGQEWSDWRSSNTKEVLEVRNLAAHTDYEIRLRAACSNGDSSLPQIVEASTLYGLPYRQDLTNLEAVPEEFETFYSLSIPEEGNAELVEAPQYATMYQSEADGRTSPGIQASTSTPTWFCFPTICLEDVLAPAEYRFRWKAYYRDPSTQELLDYEGQNRIYILVSSDKTFSADEIVDTLMLNETPAQWQDAIIDLSAFTRQVNIAIIKDNPEIDYDIDPRSNFVFDSLRAEYTGDIPCFGVENIRQYDLRDDQITLSWTGTSLEYGIYLNNTTTGEIDSLYTAETEYTITGLEPGCLYEYSIQSFCEEGHQSPGPVVSDPMYWFETNDICAVPTGFAIIDSTWQTVTITGHSEADKQIHVWACDTARYPDLNYYFGPWYPHSDTVTISGIYEEIHVAYNVAIRSTCSAAAGDTSQWTETLVFSTPIPQCGAPTNLQSQVSAHSADLSWTPGSGNDWYQLMHRPASATSFDTTDVYMTSYTLQELDERTAYVWQLQGICDDLLASPLARAEFTTEGSSNETALESGFAVRSMGGRICILNPGMLPMERVEVFNASGRLLYSQDVQTTDNLLLPDIETASGLKILRIFSGNGSVTFKIPLL